MHCLKRDAHTSNVFEHLNILKLPDKISLENCILICKYFNESLLKSFKNWFTLAATSHTLIPDGLTQVILKQLLIKRKYMEDIQSM